MVFYRILKFDRVGYNYYVIEVSIKSKVIVWNLEL